MTCTYLETDAPLPPSSPLSAQPAGVDLVHPTRGTHATKFAHDESNLYYGGHHQTGVDLSLVLHAGSLKEGTTDFLFPIHFGIIRVSRC